MRILLAEDEKELSRALVAILEHEKYEVDAVYDGQAALDAGLQNTYDCIVMDIMMPKMDGITALSHLRQQGVMAPVLLLTAKAQVNDRITGLDAGANDYLAKPFAMGEMLARLRALMRRPDAMAPSQISIANIRLDRTNFELSSPSAAVRLGNKEFQMLEMLLQNVNRTLTTAQFMERLWSRSEAEDNVILIYIAYLRRKLASLNAAVRINGSAEAGFVLEVISDE